jgi:hypothetical protein
VRPAAIAIKPKTTWTIVINEPGLVGKRRRTGKLAMREGAMMSSTVTIMLIVAMAIMMP